MPERLAIEIPALQLAGGISQQPAHERLPGQVEAAANVDFSVVDGIVKRSGTRFIKVLGTAPAVPVRMHPIDRDGSERYLAIVGAGVFSVYDPNGVAQTVNISAAAATYIATNTATAEQLRLRSIADSTIVLNTTVPVATTYTPDYTITGDYMTYSRMVAHTPVEGTYHRTIEAQGLEPPGYYVYDVGGNTFPTATFAGVSGGTLADPAGTWDAAGNKGFKIRMQRREASFTNAVWDNTAKTLTKSVAGVGAWAQYVWKHGDDQRIDSGTGFTAGYYRIEEKVSNSVIRLSSSYAIANTADVTTASPKGISQEYDVQFDSTTGTLSSMYEVAQFIQNKVWDAGGYDTLVEWVSTGVQAGYFVITGRWRGSGTTVLYTAAPSAGTDLSAAGQPFDNAAVTLVAGTATPGGNNSRDLPIDSRWMRVAAPSQADGRLDTTTMPMILVRTVLGSPSTFTLGIITWNDRTAGTAQDNPSPSLWQEGLAIADVSFYKSRLGLFGGEHAVFSQTSDIYNFFIADPLNLVDSDPVDLPLSSNQVCLIDYAQPFRDHIVLFTMAGEQFEVSSQDAFTPSTASVTVTTRYTTLSVRPQPMAGLMYFFSTAKLLDGTGYTQLREMYYDDVLVATDAVDASSHVPRLLPAAMRTIAIHQNTKTVVCLPNASNVLYLYRTYWQGPQKVQSAWTTHTFDASYTILDVAILGDELFVLAKTGTQMVLEAVPLYDEPAATGMPYPIRLDRRLTLTGGTFSAGATTWTLPGTISDNTLNDVVLGPLYDTPGTELTPTRPSATTIRVTGDYSAHDVYAGKLYTASVTLSRPYARGLTTFGGVGPPNLVNGFRQSRLTSLYRASGGYSVRMTRTPEGEADIVLSFSPTVATVLQDGTFSANARGDVERIVQSIESTSAMPMRIGGLVHEGYVAVQYPR